MSEKQLNLFGNNKSTKKSQIKKPYALRNVSDKGVKYYMILKDRGVTRKLSIHPAGICQSIYLTVLTTNTMLSKKTDKEYTQYSNNMKDNWVYRLDDKLKPHHLTLEMLKNLVDESDPNNKENVRKDSDNIKESESNEKSTTKPAK